MLSSPNPPISSTLATALSLTSFTSFTSFIPFTSSSYLAQSLPIFSTPSKHRTHTNSRNSTPFMRLLHSSLFTHIPRCHLPSNRLFHSGPLFPLHPIPTTRTRVADDCDPAPLTPFLVYPEPRRATLPPREEPRGTSSSQLAENPATLSPFPVTLTSLVTPNSFVCHSYKKHPGVGYPPFPNFSAPPLRSLRLCVIFSFSLFLSFPAVAAAPSQPLDDPSSLRRYLITSFLRLMKRFLLLHRHTPCKQYPVAAPSRIRQQVPNRRRLCVSMRVSL
jgi:hypothetical protein